MNPQELDALVGRRVDVIWPGKKKWEKKIEPSCSFLAWADDMMLTAQLALIYLYSFNSLSIMTNSFERLGLSRGKKKKKTNGHQQTDDGIDERDRILSALFAHLTFNVFGRRVVLEDGHFLTLADCKVNGLSSLLQCNGNVASAAAPSGLGRGLQRLLNLLR